MVVYVPTENQDTCQCDPAVCMENVKSRDAARSIFPVELVFKNINTRRDN